MTTRGSTRMLALVLAAVLTLAACGGDDDEAAADDGASEADGGDGSRGDAGGSLDDAELQSACDDLADEVATATERGDAILEEAFGTNDPAPDTEFGSRYEEIVDVLGVVLLSAGDVLDLVEDWEGADDIADEVAAAQDDHELVEDAYAGFQDSASESTTFADLFTVLQDSGAQQSYGKPVVDAITDAGIDCDPF